jgi:hypothetical protein
MIWLDFATNTKIFGAFITPNTIFSHMNRSFLAHNLAIIIFLILLHLSLYKIHYVSTSAFHEIRILWKKFFFLICLNRLFLVLINVLIKFILLNIQSACWAPNLLILTQFINGICCKTLFMYFMKALRGLEHNNILIIKIIILQELTAEFAIIFIYRCLWHLAVLLF